MSMAEGRHLFASAPCFFMIGKGEINPGNLAEIPIDVKESSFEGFSKVSNAVGYMLEQFG